ncbi:flagellar basal body-associated protein FliL [Colwellia psychrerythraea]|uniref:Flagellar protein FliL n=1 Tax=Colwellia psychrerythraea (strain 34H / ATCC BAA-681) TaxID=167879 RepID=Q485L5_COLP3|nr:flagellar basal body-associated protein FliL [Colwellia psychrerythraea]AAZ27459.1 flagellar protein FliL [Colwellia psychrerythraea 34H]
MADEKDNGKEGELELDKSGKKKKIIIIIIAVVVLLGGGAGAYFFFMGGVDNSASQAELDTALDSDSGEVTKVESGAQLGSALYVPMPRPFRFNVPGAARDRFVEIRVQLLVRGGDNEENAKMHIPLIESTLLDIFSQANADDLATSAGKVSLKQKSLAAVQKIMTDIEGDKTVEKVLFTGFVMQ